VLGVDAVDPGLESLVIDDRDGDGGGIPGNGIDRERRLVIVDFGTFCVEVAAEAKRMRGESPVSRVDLDAVSPIASEYPGSSAVIDQVAVDIRFKRYRRIAAEGRDLVVEFRPDSALKSEHPEVVLFELVLIDARRRIDRDPREREDLRLIGIRRDLEMI